MSEIGWKLLESLHRTRRPTLLLAVISVLCMQRMCSNQSLGHRLPTAICGTIIYGIRKCLTQMFEWQRSCERVASLLDSAQIPPTV